MNDNVHALLAEALGIMSPRESRKFGAVCAILTGISKIHPTLV